MSRRMIMGAAGAVMLTCGGMAAAQPSRSAQAPIGSLNQALVMLEKNASRPFQARYDALAPAIDRAFDLPQVLKTIVGLRWSELPAAKQKQLLDVFRAFTICNYVANFNSESGDQFRLLPETRAVGADQVVGTEIVPKTGDPTRIDYVMRQNGASWQAVDVLQDGTISQAAVQRSDFRSLLAGGNADGLIASLHTKIGTLSGGAIAP